MHLMLSISGLIHYHVIPRVYPSMSHHTSFRRRKNGSSNARMKKMPSVLKCNIHGSILVFLRFSRVVVIRGRWGGFETLEKWVTGAFAGDTAVCLKDDMGNLWVGESGHENEKGEEIIVVIPWEGWWELALKDNSNPQIALLPLHPEVRAKFNYTAAWEYARSMSGKPYGYHNMIFSWIE